MEREEILATSHFLGQVHHELAVILGSLAVPKCLRSLLKYPASLPELPQTFSSDDFRLSRFET